MPMRSLPLRPAEPRHVLAAVQGEGGVLVRVFLFREYTWAIPFPGVALPGARRFHAIDLVTGDDE